MRVIPEQFTVKAHPALFGGRGKGQKKLCNTFQRLRPEEFSAVDFGLRSFRQPEISTWGVFVGWRFRPGSKSTISPAENSAFSREGAGRGRDEGGAGGLRCRTCQLFYVDDFGNLIPIVNTHSVFPKINTHSGDCALGGFRPQGSLIFIVGVILNTHFNSISQTGFQNPSKKLEKSQR